MQEQDVELVHCGKRNEIVSDEGIVYKDVLPNKKSYGDLRTRVLYMFPCVSTMILVKKTALEEVGVFDENLKFWQDYELLIRLAQRITFGCVEEPLILYRKDKKDSNRLTNKYFEWKKAVQYIRKKHSLLYGLF